MSFENASLKELLALQPKLDAAIAAAREAEKQAVKDKVQALIAKSGLSLKDVLGHTRKGRAKDVAVKFRNPANPSQTWTGRGRHPLWLESAGGKDRCAI